MAQDKGEVVNEAVGNTIEVRMMSTLLLAAWVALSLPVCTSQEGACPRVQALEQSPVSFLHLAQPCNMPQLLPGPPHHWGLSCSVGTGETYLFLSTAPVLLSQFEFCHLIKWKRNHGCSEDGLMHRN